MTILNININAFCNEECEFCSQTLDRSILPEEDILRLVDASPDAQSIQISGGEPFMDKRLVLLLVTLRERGRNVHVVTNATVLPKGLLDLEERIRRGIQIQASLHASTRELYHKITGRDKFSRVLTNIRRLKPAYTTLISTVAYQANREDIPHIVDLAIDKLHVPIRINLVFPIGKGKDVERLTFAQVDRLRGYLLAQHLQRPGMVESPLIHPNICAAITSAYSIPKVGSCPVDCAAKTYVSPRGEISSCEFLQIGGQP